MRGLVGPEIDVPERIAQRKPTPELNDGTDDFSARLGAVVAELFEEFSISPMGIEHERCVWNHCKSESIPVPRLHPAHETTVVHAHGFSLL